MSTARILIVEDERITAESVKCTLEELGYAVCAIVGTGSEAVQKARTERPDLVLMDIVLRGTMDGIEAAEQIRSAYGIPIVFATAYADEPLLHRAKVTGPYGYIIKPFTARELHSNVEMALHKGRLDRQIARLNAVLDTIRRVNQLVIREHAPDRLLQQLCELLVERGGYTFAWAVLIDEAGQLVRVAQTNMDAAQFQLMVELLRRGDRPTCFPRALAQPGRVLISRRATDCPDCLLNNQHPEAQALTARLGRTDQNFGFLCAGGPAGLAIDEAESALFGELADDIAVALHAINVETQRERTEEARLRLATAIEQAAEAVVITDPAGTIQYVNPAFEHVTGYTRAEAVGQNTRLLKSGQHGPEFYRELWDTITCGKPWKGRFTNRRKDGAHYEEDATISPVFDASGQITNFVAVKRDVTQELALAAQLRQAQKMEAVGQLAAGVAHDFNNLLTAIYGYVDLARDTLPSEHAALDALHGIEVAARQATGVTRGLLTFSGRAATKKEIVDVRTVLRDSTRLLRHLLPAAINLELDTPGGVALWAQVDPTQLQQVLMNLAVNARDAMPRGGRLRIAARVVEGDRAPAAASADASSGIVQIEVSDTGVGLTPEVQARIFEPFFTTKPFGRGTGLGLAIIRRIVQEHGGRVEVESAPGAGSTFRVFLPCATAAAIAEAASECAARTRGRGELVLLAEDDPCVRDIMATALGDQNYNVIRVADGAALWDQYRECRGTLALLILDVDLPQRSGLDCLAAIRAGGDHVPALVITADSGTLPEALGPNAMLVRKPVRSSELVRIAAQVIGANPPQECPV